MQLFINFLGFLVLHPFGGRHLSFFFPSSLGSCFGFIVLSFLCFPNPLLFQFPLGHGMFLDEVNPFELIINNNNIVPAAGVSRWSGAPSPSPPPYPFLSFFSFEVSFRFLGCGSKSRVGFVSLVGSWSRWFRGR